MFFLSKWGRDSLSLSDASRSEIHGYAHFIYPNSAFSHFRVVEWIYSQRSMKHPHEQITVGTRFGPSRRSAREKEVVNQPLGFPPHPFAACY